MSPLEAFRTEIEDYLQERGLAATAFGNEALGDPNFVFDIREGREPRLSTIERVREFMADHAEEIAQ